MNWERKYYSICDPCSVSALGNFSLTEKANYLNKLKNYQLVPLFQPDGFNRVLNTPSTRMDTNYGIAMFADPEITCIYPEEVGRAEAIAVCGYDSVVYNIEGHEYVVWEIRQYQTVVFAPSGNRNREFNRTLGFFDYKAALREYVKQLARYNAEVLDNVDFVSEMIEYHEIDRDIHIRALALSGSERPSMEYYQQADYEIQSERMRYLSAKGLTYPLVKPRGDGTLGVTSMGVWVGDIIPNEDVQSTMAISRGYPGQDYYRY